jgi:hypothetical protein
MTHFSKTLLIGVLVVVLIVAMVLQFIGIRKTSLKLKDLREYIPASLSIEHMKSMKSMKEGYVDNQASLPWTIYNKKFMRQLEFTPPHAPIPASFRALTSTEDIKSIVNNGQCAPFNKPSFANEEGLSILKERELVYSLKHECLSLPNARPSTVNNFSVSFRNLQDWNTYAYLILLNPLYVEFSSPASSTSTIAYFLKKPNGFTMSNKGIGSFNAVQLSDDLMGTCKRFMSSLLTQDAISLPSSEIPLVPVHNDNEQSTSTNDVDQFTLFTYADYSKRTYNLLPIKEKELMSIRAYYLDEIKPSTQALIRALNYSQNPTGVYKVFLANYDNTTDTQLSEAYPYTYNIGANLFREFCKYIYRCHTNSVYFPVFTITFDLAINKRTFAQSFTNNTRYQILEMSMKNGIGAQTFACSNNVDYSKAAFTKNANIISCSLTTSSDDTCSLELTSSRNGCTYTSRNLGDVLKVSLPMVDTAATAKTYVTITPYKIHVLVCWHKPLEGLQWVYSEKDIAEGNDFETLFTKKNLPNNTLADIDITVAPQVINQVSEVKLGYKNFALELKNKM